MKSIETLARVDVLCVDKTGTITSDVMEVYDVVGSYKEESDEVRRAKNILSKYIMTLPDNNITMMAMREYFNEKETLNYLEIRPFDSKKKYSEVITEDYTYRLGAPEYLLTEKQLNQNDEIISKFTHTGKRVITLVEQESGSNNSKPILFIALYNEIRENAKTTFASFAR